MNRVAPPSSSPPAQPSKSLARSFLISIAITGLCASILVVWSGFVGGKAFADRAITDFAMPVGLIWLGSFAATLMSLLRGHRATACLCFAVWVFIGVAFSTPIGKSFLRTVEIQADQPPLNQLEEPVDVVVLLGGYADINRLGTIELSIDGQRLFLTAQLWHSGKTKAIVCTGTAHFGEYHPSRVGTELLTSVGVPSEAIFQVAGVNTSKEMENLKSFFESPPPELVERIGAKPTRIALVTSAYHMARAMRLAEQQELDLIPIACQFAGTAEPTTNPRDLIPSAIAGDKFARATKEWIAWMVGR
ncbi:MAG: YdcF family protein [Planctomycetota bacterium]